MPAPHHNLPDEDLLAAYQRTGQQQFLGELLQRYTLLLLGVCLKYLKDKEAAQDAVQQVFLKVITHLPAGQILNFKGWLYVLARNYCLQLLRDKKHFAGDEVLAHVATPEGGLHAALEKEFTLQQLETALLELAPPQQQCVRAFYLQQQSYQEIMDQTGYSFAQVKSYIQNGKRNLRQRLAQKLNKQP